MTDASDWRGRVGETWADQWERTDRSFGALSVRLNDAILQVAPQIGTALDIGCGAGATSLALAGARPRLQLTGVDLSAAQVAVARKRAAAFPNLAIVEGDVLEIVGTHAPIDLMFSRHGVMFFADPVAAFAALHNAAATGAPLVFSTFRARQANAWISQVAAAVTGAVSNAAVDAPGPFAFANYERVNAILSGAGWRDIAAEKVDYFSCTGVGDDPVADSLAFFQHIGPVAPVLRAMVPSEREVALARIAGLCMTHRRESVVEFPATAWIWSARA